MMTERSEAVIARLEEALLQDVRYRVRPHSDPAYRIDDKLLEAFILKHGFPGPNSTLPATPLPWTGAQISSVAGMICLGQEPSPTMSEYPENVEEVASNPSARQRHCFDYLAAHGVRIFTHSFANNPEDPVLSNEEEGIQFPNLLVAYGTSMFASFNHYHYTQSRNGPHSILDYPECWPLLALADRGKCVLTREEFCRHLLDGVAFLHNYNSIFTPWERITELQADMFDVLSPTWRQYRKDGTGPLFAHPTPGSTDWLVPDTDWAVLLDEINISITQSRGPRTVVRSAIKWW